MNRRAKIFSSWIGNVATVTVAAIMLTGCASTKNLELDSQFPVPLIKKTPLNMGILLEDELRAYTYHEVIEKKGEWNVAVGPVQEKLFTNLATGMFSEFALVEDLASIDTEAVLKPLITDLQFSLPDQTRTDFYEVWIRYQFQLYDNTGTVVAEWALPAYGKASKKDFGSAYKGVEAAAIAACRDAMAFFALNSLRNRKLDSGWRQDHRHDPTYPCLSVGAHWPLCVRNIYREPGTAIGYGYERKRCLGRAGPA